jgi:hypothetical protein
MVSSKFSTTLVSLLLCSLFLVARADAANVCDPTTGTRCIEVSSKNVARTITGKADEATYIASSSALVTTALYSQSIEAEAGRGFRVARVCVGVTNATAAAGVTVTINRRSTASSGGTAATAEGTGADSVSKMDPDDSSWSGVVRRTGTLGTIGATLDQWTFQIGELGAGAADPPGPSVQCKNYGQWGAKMLRVLAGVNNGISISVSSLGAGGLAFGSISTMFIAE